MGKALAMILAGGRGTRLSILAEERTKPAVPFAGKYRIIDFTLSNCINSGIDTVGVLTQYRPRSLTEHIGIGRAWDLDREYGGIFMLHPYTGRRAAGWYAGTADAVYQNLDFIEERKVDDVVILAGDHIYKMRYDQMLDFHHAKGADATVGVFQVPVEDGSRFGIMAVSPGGEIVEFEEKPARPKSTLASMGIYIFSTKVMARLLEEDAANPKSDHDFGRNIIPGMIGKYKVYAYPFNGYWQDVGTVESYWQANMEFLEYPSPLEIDSVQIRTRAQDRNPAKILGRGSVVNSMICNGCVIHGTVRHSVLGQGVIVEEGAEVIDSIIFDDTVIKKGATVKYSVIDKVVVVGEDSYVGWGEDNTPNQDEPKNLYAGITVVGKRAIIPARQRIGRNCKIIPGATPYEFPSSGVVPSGITIGKLPAVVMAE